jgi:hypothetical protein
MGMNGACSVNCVRVASRQGCGEANLRRPDGAVNRRHGNPSVPREMRAAHDTETHGLNQNATKPLDTL